MKAQTGTCPFNPNHKFAPEKLAFHINRCKDRAKVAHKFAKCRFNPMHFVLKQELEAHQEDCPNSSQYIAISRTLKASYERALEFRERRERSRERNVKQEERSQLDFSRITHIKKEEEQAEENAEEYHLLEECEECQRLLVKYKAKIQNDPDSRLSKLLVRYGNLS